MTAARTGTAAMLFLLTACDTLYPPSITNGFGTNVIGTAIFADGKIMSSVWSPCSTGSLGRKGIPIVKLTIENDGGVLQEYSADQVREMAEKKDHSGFYMEWIAGPDGISELKDWSRSPCGQKKTEADPTK